MKEKWTSEGARREFTLSFAWSWVRRELKLSRGGQNSLGKSDWVWGQTAAFGKNNSSWNLFSRGARFLTWAEVFYFHVGLAFLVGSWENTKRQHKLPFLSVFSKHSWPLTFLLNKYTPKLACKIAALPRVPTHTLTYNPPE